MTLAVVRHTHIHTHKEWSSLRKRCSRNRSICPRRDVGLAEPFKGIPFINTWHEKLTCSAVNLVSNFHHHHHHHHHHRRSHRVSSRQEVPTVRLAAVASGPCRVPTIPSRSAFRHCNCGSSKLPRRRKAGAALLLILILILRV